MAAQSPGSRIEGNVMRFSVDKHDTQPIGFCAYFDHEFFSRVPSFVWKNLQILPRLPSTVCLRFSKWVRSFTVEHWPVGGASRRPKPERSALQGDRPGADMTARRAR